MDLQIKNTDEVIVVLQCLIDTLKATCQNAEEAKAQEQPQEKPWPQFGDTYYSIGFGIGDDPVEAFDWYDDPIDYTLMSEGMVFRTKEEVKKLYHHIIIENKLRAMADCKPGECGFMLYYVPGKKHVGVEWSMYLRGVPMFSTEEKAREIIDGIGLEDLIHYWFEA